MMWADIMNGKTCDWEFPKVMPLWMQRGEVQIDTEWKKTEKKEDNLKTAKKMPNNLLATTY